MSTNKKTSGKDIFGEALNKSMQGKDLKQSIPALKPEVTERKMLILHSAELDMIDDIRNYIKQNFGERNTQVSKAILLALYGFQPDPIRDEENWKIIKATFSQGKGKQKK